MLAALGGVVATQTAPPPPALQSVGTVVVVTTSKGQPVLDLGPAQLAAEVDGQPARIEYMQAVGRALAVVLMLDVSGSMFSALDHRIGQELGRQVPAALRGDDVVRFGAVGGQVVVGGIAPHTKEYFTAPPALIERPFAQSTARALLTSPLWDAVAAGVDALRADERHRLIVLVTDGMVTGSRIGLDGAVRLAARAQTAVSVIDMHWPDTKGVKQDNQKARLEFRPDEALRRLTASTGGSYFAEVRARTGVLRNGDSDMPELVVKAITESRGAYRIGLPIPADAAPHSVKITSTRAGLVIRTPAEIRR
jgi:hypothetical protein